MIEVPLVDLNSQYRRYKKEIDAAVAEVLESGNFILGSRAHEFEVAFAEFCNAKQCVGVGNGTDALILALQALGIGADDEVITTPWTFMATVEAICCVGARPVFADINPINYCIEPRQIPALVTEKTKAVIPVHIYGYLVDMDAIMRVAGEHKLKVIEDAAQAHGAERLVRRESGQSWRAGSCGDVATFSFYPSKNLGAYGDAGAITTNNEQLAHRLRELRNHGTLKKNLHHGMGWNSRLDALQAAVLLVKLRHLTEWNAKRLRLAEWYNRELTAIAKSVGVEIVCPSPVNAPSHVFHLYTIRVPKRDELVDYLQQQGIGCAIYYPVALHQQPALKKLGVASSPLPYAERAAKEVVSLPLCPELSEANQNRIVELIQAFFKR